MTSKVKTTGLRLSVFRIVSIIYFALLFYITLFLSDRQRVYNYRQKINLHLLDKATGYHLLSSYGKFLFFVDIFGNIALFLPFVAAINTLFSVRSKLLLAFLILFTTVCIESLQFIFNLGVFDVDDIFLNFMGGVVGIKFFNWLKIKYKT